MPAGPWTYGTIDDVFAEMGTYNAQTAADPDASGDATLVTSHEQQAGDFAQGFIDSRLTMNGFATPATVNLFLLKTIFAKLAAWQLDQVRGLHDAKKGNAFTEKYDFAVEQLDELTFGGRGGFARAAGYSDAPVAVGPTVDAQGHALPTQPYPRPFWDGYFWRWG